MVLPSVSHNMEHDFHPTKVKQPIYNMVDLICYAPARGCSRGNKKEKRKLDLGLVRLAVGNLELG